jgi:hypothetical protein
MLRVVRMSGKYYGFDMSDESDREKMKQIEGFLDEGTPVILVNDLSDLESLDIDPTEVKMVEPN